MKNIKRVLALILSLFCMVALFGCSGLSNNYVKDSLYFRSTYIPLLKRVSTTVSFEVNLPDFAEYEITYTLELYYGTDKLEEETFSDTRVSSGNETAIISKSWSVDYTGNNVDDNNFDVRLVSLTVEIAENISDTTYEGLSIGFGVAGGVILIGILALYICLNKHSKKEHLE